MEELLKGIDPRFLPAIVPSSFLVRTFVNQGKEALGWTGKVCHRAAYGIAVPVTFFVLLCLGAMNHPWAGPEWLAAFLASMVSGAGAIGTHETLSHRNAGE